MILILWNLSMKYLEYQLMKIPKRFCYIFEKSPIMCNNSSICLLFPHKKKKFLQVRYNVLKILTIQFTNINIRYNVHRNKHSSVVFEFNFSQNRLGQVSLVRPGHGCVKQSNSQPFQFAIHSLLELSWNNE